MYESDVKQPTFNKNPDKIPAVPSTVGKGKIDQPEYSAKDNKKNNSKKELDIGELDFDDDDVKLSNPKLLDKSGALNKQPKLSPPVRPTDAKLDPVIRLPNAKPVVLTKPAALSKPAAPVNPPVISNSQLNKDPFGEDSELELDFKEPSKPVISKQPAVPYPKEQVKALGKIDPPKGLNLNPIVKPVVQTKPPVAKPPLDSKNEIKKPAEDDDWGLDDKDQNSNDF